MVVLRVSSGVSDSLDGGGRSSRLTGLVAMGERGFLLTGRHLPEGAWPLLRLPLPFERSLPGVLAAGDVRFGSVKRVAGAVGEGSVTVGSEYVAGFDARQRRPCASDR
ncbi:hypothetical protein GCM10009740_20700 [Terrabacter terrae]|uniref:Uncharacterized protein n=1 Tax=Terrabacter terrae TaxID=318434 RepID=A0ABN2U9L8_9MICO